MSKILDAIELEILTSRKARYPKLTTYKDYETSPIIGEYDLIGYTVGVHWNVTGFARSKDMQEVLKNVTRQLKEEVYGELRQSLLELERSLYEEDVQTSLSCVRSIIREYID